MIFFTAYTSYCFSLALQDSATPLLSGSAHCEANPLPRSSGHFFALPLRLISLPYLCASFLGVSVAEPLMTLPFHRNALLCISTRLSSALRCRAVPSHYVADRYIAIPWLCGSALRHSLAQPRLALPLLCHAAARLALALHTAQDFIGKPPLTGISPLTNASQSTIVQHFHDHFFVAIQETLDRNIHCRTGRN